MDSKESLQLQRLEEALWIQETRFDIAYMEEVLTEAFVEFGRSGKVYSREEALSQSSTTIAASLPLEDFKAQMVSILAH